MVDHLFSLDNHQIDKIGQIALDRDEKEALKFIIEIDKKLKSRQAGCDPLGQGMRGKLDNVLSKYKNK